MKMKWKMDTTEKRKPDIKLILPNRCVFYGCSVYGWVSLFWRHYAANPKWYSCIDVLLKWDKPINVWTQIFGLQKLGCFRPKIEKLVTISMLNSLPPRKIKRSLIGAEIKRKNSRSWIEDLGLVVLYWYRSVYCSISKFWIESHFSAKMNETWATNF